MRKRCITSPERVFELSEFGDDLVNMLMQIWQLEMAPLSGAEKE